MVVDFIMIGIVILFISFLATAYIYRVANEVIHKDKEYIEPNEFITLQDCLEMYYHDGRRVVIEDGQISVIE